MDLAKRKCAPCRGDTPKVTGDVLTALVAELGNDWDASGDRLRKTFRFPDFASALAFVNRVGEVAEREEHHPDIHLAWGRVGLEIWTHAIGGLSENDFVLAAKIEELSG